MLFQQSVQARRGQTGDATCFSHVAPRAIHEVGEVAALECSQPGHTGFAKGIKIGRALENSVRGHAIDGCFFLQAFPGNLDTDVIGQVLRIEQRLLTRFGDDHLDRVRQFAHISRPVVIQDEFDKFGGEFFRWNFIFPADPFDKNTAPGPAYRPFDFEGAEEQWRSS